MKVVSYNEGRDKALKSLREWLNHHYPQKPIEERHLAFVKFRDREKALEARAKMLAEKAKPKVGWRDELSNRLVLNEEETLQVTNTILELTEQALANGERVRINAFGDFVTTQGRSAERKVVFKPVESWHRELNAPLYQNEIGLKKKLKKGKLSRREV